MTVALCLSVFGCATPEKPDPWEPMNRGIFAFNETLDRYAIEPAAKAWDTWPPAKKLVKASPPPRFMCCETPEKAISTRSTAASWKICR
ncbi:MAG: VacJ family lipoprotein, partial [Gemmatimonadetes bacterium]|nr:VacJ family lipoprotein [Gemmatimonadota bacterium]